MEGPAAHWILQKQAPCDRPYSESPAVSAGREPVTPARSVAHDQIYQTVRRTAQSPPNRDHRCDPTQLRCPDRLVRRAGPSGRSQGLCRPLSSVPVKVWIAHEPGLALLRDLPREVTVELLTTPDGPL